jgi:hypothetical protein
MRIAHLCFFLITLAPLCSAQAPDRLPSDVSKAIDGMNSSSWTVRQKALREMPDISKVARIDASQADRLRLGVMHLLTVENGERQQEKRPGAWSEERSEYYANLIDMVADFNDERAISALVGAATTGGMATRGLARFGDLIVEPTINQLNSPDSTVRSSALFTIRDLFNLHKSLSSASYARIESALQSSLADHEGNVRFAAIVTIEFLPTREKFVPFLKELSLSDPLALPATKGGQFYPVRLTATDVLDHIARHLPPPFDTGVR